MSKFKPGDIVYYMDGCTLCQAVVCVEDGQWPIVPDGYCSIYNISPTYGTRGCKHREEASQFCDVIEKKRLYTSAENLISAIKSDLKQEYDKKIRVLDEYNKGSAEQKQSLAKRVEDILLGRDVKEAT